MSSGKAPRSFSQCLLLSLEDKSHDGNRIRRRNMAPSANHWNNSNMGHLRTAFAENSRKGYNNSFDAESPCRAQKNTNPNLNEITLSALLIHDTHSGRQHLWQT
jgi:hypothetical protein